jgi:hypothetical protein
VLPPACLQLLNLLLLRNLSELDPLVGVEALVQQLSNPHHLGVLQPRPQDLGVRQLRPQHLVAVQPRPQPLAARQQLLVVQVATRQQRHGAKTGPRLQQGLGQAQLRLG